MRSAEIRRRRRGWKRLQTVYRQLSLRHRRERVSNDEEPGVALEDEGARASAVGIVGFRVWDLLRVRRVYEGYVEREDVIVTLVFFEMAKVHDRRKICGAFE